MYPFYQWHEISDREDGNPHELTQSVQSLQRGHLYARSVLARHPLFVCQRRELQELLDSGLDGWNHYAHMFQFLNISRAHGPWLSPSGAIVPFWVVQF